MHVRLCAAQFARLSGSRSALQHKAPRARSRATTVCRAVGLRLYTKPNCPLCDGLQEKLTAVRSKAAFTGGFWAAVDVEVWPSSVSGCLQLRASKRAQSCCAVCIVLHDSIVQCS